MDFNIAKYFIALLTPSTQSLIPTHKDMDLLNVNIHLSCQYEPFPDFNVSLTIIQTIWY